MTMSPLVISKAFPPCHTEPLGEVSHNTESTTESKRDFSPFSKAQNDNKASLVCHTDLECSEREVSQH